MTYAVYWLNLMTLVQPGASDIVTTTQYQALSIGLK